jgi:hypothetical protein
MFTKDIPVIESKYAKEGTLAHNCLECIMANVVIHADYMANDMFNHEMLEYTYQCANYLNKLKKNCDLFLIERKVNIKPIQGFGFIDYLVLKDDILHVIDLKYGKSRVKAENNTQLKLYAYGAYKLLEPLADINRIELHIMQPRVNKNGNFTSWVVPIKTLLEWAEYIVSSKAQTAFSGNGIFKPGNWCFFCPGRDKCTHLIVKDFE